MSVGNGPPSFQVDLGNASGPHPELSLKRRLVYNFVSQYVIFSLFFITDLIILLSSMGASIWIRLNFLRWLPNVVGPEQYVQLLYGVVALPFAYALAGVYPGYGLHPVERLRRRTLVTTLVFVILIFWEFLVRREASSRGILLLTYTFALLFVPVGDAILRSFLRKVNLWGTPVVLIGTDAARTKVLRRVLEFQDLGYVPVCTLSPDEASLVRDGFPGVHTAIVAYLPEEREEVLSLLPSLRYGRVLLVEEREGVQSLWVTTRDLGGTLALELKQNLLDRRNRIVKRLMDVLLGGILFLVSLPLILLLVALVFLVSPGNPFFVQEREGLGGRAIRVWKLRTMYPDAEARLQKYLESSPEAYEEWNRYFKLKHDPRILPGIGHFLRKTSLDELPQLWNVVRGEMSLVGPRPFPFYHLEAFDEEFRELRRSVLPGMTGLWQVSARSDGDVERQRLLDSYYIRNWSLWLDVYILALTFFVVIRGKGAY
ncbi:exopolysaccharide biosynthesis polyprenyl glycosylphosphotransferase [Brockia lithotrophica]|uniref:Undecaprenyl-phosphate galactose phosphotransferase WbaP/exopolysaccharide biosynthesis polyprenyl glycosylphosphotransferase n=1 Tax=Brockia lithotrophica TaxID=933949 RepID=A0A660L5Y3_9BACL|nr:exopolysaccharide biosynthesis polyprenyl glycosylphosphotransferase [Brockia lithotrophica]RKQ88838.1 Undecaprenyl-phosphate galactose phosphotransferase WbaP/exopolysaccharide biosynthesis polyprenyl glycosylphosphotransferase [Brockia lithotrophica]